jgi:hypothetical protein
MPAVRWMLDFLELRPVFTLRLAQVCWWLYILAKLYFTPWGVYRIITSAGPASWRYNWLEALYQPFRVLVLLATARLLLDVLLAILWPERQMPRAPQPLGRELLAFLDLRPFFTRWWIQVFWWLYLLNFLHSLYGYTFIGRPYFNTATLDDWARLFRGFLENGVWLVGVRLLVEAALKTQTPAPTDLQPTGA